MTVLHSFLTDNFNITFNNCERSAQSSSYLQGPVPWRKHPVMCDTYTPRGEPIPTNKRHKAAEIFNDPKVAQQVPCRMSSGLWVGQLEHTLVLRVLTTVLLVLINPSVVTYLTLTTKPVCMLESTSVEQMARLCLASGSIKLVQAWESKLEITFGFLDTSSRELLNKLVLFSHCTLSGHPKVKWKVSNLS